MDMVGRVLETIADGIAIEILNGHAIITGKGNELHLFTRPQNNAETEHKSMWEEQVLDTKLINKIHGIHKNHQGNVLLVYGEKEFVLLQACQNQFIEFFRASLSDWISCGCFIINPQEVVLLTAHSIILRFDYDVLEKTCSLKERISCTDKSTLYCAHLYGTTWKKLVVFSGNAFGELLIWQPSQNAADMKLPTKPKMSSLIHRIPAHNGVIFSIDYDENAERLITTSDDRAVKWWKVLLLEAMESNWEKSSLKPVASGYGHISRVFKGRIIRNDSNVYALSVGEDSYLCLWNGKGELLFKRRQQFGATIWNFAYDQQSKTVYTIGSNGNVVAYDMSCELQKETKPPNIELLLPIVNEERPKEYIAKVKFLGDHDIVGITNENRLMRLTLESQNKVADNNSSSWGLIEVAGMDFKCTVMEVYGNRIAICGYKRLMVIEWKKENYRFDKILDEHMLEGVIHGFIFFSQEDFLVGDSKGNCVLYLEAQNVRRQMKLPVCKEPWLTTALLINQGQFLMVTNRLGNLLLYKLNSAEGNYDLCDVIKHIHGNLGATQLQVVCETKHKALVRSCGHDGAIKVFSLDFEEVKLNFCYRENVPLSCVENICKEDFTHDLFLGFNDSHFVVWSRKYDVLIKLDCGGGHRCWHFRTDFNDNNISLVFIKNKRVKFHRMPLINQGLMYLPAAKRWHTAPCNTMEALKSNDATQDNIVVTAGDDIIIKIHTLTKHQELVLRKELHSHISNVRTLKLLALNSEEFLIFSGGGRAQLCIAKVNSQNFHIEELQNYTLKAKEGMMTPAATNKQNQEKYNFNPETRLMSIDIKELDNKGNYLLFIGCSDGYIRCLIFELSSLVIEQAYEYFCNRCLLQVRYIKEYDHLLTADTNGRVCIFNTNLELVQGPLHIQDGGINGISTKYNADKNTLEIFSSGDGQQIAYTVLDTTTWSKTSLSRFWHVHTSQICAAVLSTNGRYGYTCGVDQWLYKIDIHSGDVVDSFYSCVADIKGLCLLQDEICLIYGNGLQVFMFNK
uniref:tRNA (34-2'-O)-methyltransferase regulator WDR6 n=1 Tax=Stomoxys calcitrans TaxID=35570 RepID=A0A1I8PBN5_STOCA